MNKLLLLMLSVTLNAGAVEAGAVTIPNSFTAGTTSSAAQVNANFAAVKTAVDDNDARVTTLSAAIVPAGSMLPFAGAAAPTNWLLCNGAAVSRTTYANLFTAIGIAWGSGDGTTTFNLPDLRGRFIRGVDAGAGNDPNRLARTAQNIGGNTGDTVGSVQADSFQGHHHNFYSGIWGINIGQQNSDWMVRDAFNYSLRGGTYVKEPITDGVNGVPRTASETRPKNANVTYIIKY